MIKDILEKFKNLYNERIKSYIENYITIFKKTFDERFPHISKEKIALILTIILCTFLLIVINMARFFQSETKSFEIYKEALASYNSSDFQNAYYQFSKVSGRSNLKLAALFRQARCADYLGDEKSAIKKYKQLLRFYPASGLTMKSKYLLAQAIYEKDGKKAKHNFEAIIRKYPKTEYETAAHYYLGAIEADSIIHLKNQKQIQKKQELASKHFRIYLKEAPSGRLALSLISKWKKSGAKLTNADNLLIAKSYLALGDYKSAQKHLNLTSPEDSWAIYAQNAYYLKDYARLRLFTEQGMRYQSRVSQNDANEAIDKYLSVAPSRKDAISHLLGFGSSDYLFYLNCQNQPAGAQPACYNTLYYKYPNGNYAAESLANMFYASVKDERYTIATKLGQEHLRRFMHTNSAPRVMFWMGKVGERTKNYDVAANYYKSVRAKFPDNYYAYKAFLRQKRLINPLVEISLTPAPVVFPYKKSLDSDLVVKLAKLGDYGLVNEICHKDEFVQSWLAYEKGEFSNSAVIARDAMEKLETKPPKDDLRWRLVYPIHYYEQITSRANKLDVNPIMILSIIREESYFNSNAKSGVGARGLMQLMPSTAADLRVDNGIHPTTFDYLFLPDENIKLGVLYYSRLLGQLNNKDILSVAAYNGGIGSVQRWHNYLKYEDYDDFVEQIPYNETRNYIKKVFRSYWNYARIYN